MTRTAVTDADFYLLEQSLDDDGRQFLRRVREFMEKSVQPVINHYWTREEFPFDLMDGFRRLGIPGQLYQGYDCPGGGYLLDGMIAMELARVDPSISTFFGVHGGLAMGPSSCAARRSRSSAGCPRWRGWRRSARSA
ncbi:MAG: acyl-CoA dehydrogenase family protein [Streptosporangiaceae bacterium]